MGDDMNTIGKRIKYLPATNDPLSADAYYIEGDQYCYVYDVGNDGRSLQYINQLSKEMVIILSHYHKDHTGNIVGLHYRDLYVGKKTYETIGKGKLVEDVITINDGVKIEIIQKNKKFNIHIDGMDIVAENFMNIDSIEKLLLKHGIK